MMTWPWRITLTVFVLSLLGGCVYWEYSLWSECRITNSFWYCARVLNK